MKYSTVSFTFNKLNIIFLIGLLVCAKNSLAETNSWGEIKKIRPSIEGADHYGDDSFGYSVALDGNTAIVGASWYNKLYYGFAYIFDRNTGGANAWGEVKRLSASDAELYRNDLFGATVAVNEDIAIVGAPNVTAAYIFERNTGGANVWGQVKKLTVANAVGFAKSVDVSGDIAIVGASVHINQPGAAYVFQKNSGGVNAWGLVKKLIASDAEEYDEFGFSVAAEDDIVLVGSPGKNIGAMYVFRRDKGGIDAWGEVKKLTASKKNAYDFGCSVAMAGNLAVVGALSAEVDTPLNFCGSAYVFERAVDMWNEVAILTASDGKNGDYFGSSVAIAGDTVIVGAERGHDAKQNGAVYIFRKDFGGPNRWGEVKKLTATYTWQQNNIEFGCSVAIDDDFIFVGAQEQRTHYNDGKGITYIFGKFGPSPSETFTNAQSLSSGSGSSSGLAIGSNIGAATETGEPAHAGNGGPYHSVWWNWSETSSILALESLPGDALLVDTLGSDFDTVLAVYTGSAVNNLTQIAANDNAGTGIETSEVSFQFDSGQTYHIVVDGKTASDTGNVILNYAIIPEPFLFINCYVLFVVFYRRKFFCRRKTI